MGYLFAGHCRPMLLSMNNDAQTLAANTRLLLFIGPNVPLNTWAIPVQNTNVPSNNAQYQIPMAGLYLLQGNVTFTTAGSPANAKYTMGFQVVSNGSGATNYDGGSIAATTSTGTLAGMSGCELIQFNTNAATGDEAALYAITTNASPGHVSLAEFMVEWVGLPVSGSSGFSAPFGVVVGSPQPASAPASGQGTTMVLEATGGSKVIQVADPTGIIGGSTIGLDYLNGAPFTPYAEVVSVSSVNGANVNLSIGMFFSHSAGAPVAVPLSGPFMNQQVRDVCNLLAFPPAARAASNTTQSLNSQTFPAGTQITTLGSNNIDTYSAFSSNTYTCPVAGLYLVYGQVYVAGSAAGFNLAAGVQVNAGTIQWGVRNASVGTSAVTTCATFRQHIRLNVGDTVKLYGTQDSGSAMNTTSSSPAFSKLIVLWRAF